MDTQTIGIELEGTFVDKAGKPVDTLACLGGNSLKTGLPFEELTTDMGKSSLEMITTICTSGAEVRASLDRLTKLFPKGLTPIFSTRPFRNVALVEKSRMRAMRTALDRDTPGGSIGVNRVGECNALQGHIGLKDVRSDEAVFIMNYLNNIAPHARLRLINLFKIKGAEGHLMCWQGWTRTSRVPSPRWIESFDVLCRYIGAIPKLVTLKAGEWEVVPEGTLSQFGDPESEGTLWWLARLRAVYGTCEWRPFPSLDLEHVPGLADDMIVLANALYEALARHPRVLAGDEKAIGRLYADLHEVSWLAPKKRLTDEEWWKLYQL